MIVQSKNTGNPDGLPSILMWQKQKLTFENRGQDNFCHPKGIEKKLRNGQTEPKLQLWVTRGRTGVRREAKFVSQQENIKFQEAVALNVYYV